MRYNRKTVLVSLAAGLALIGVAAKLIGNTLAKAPPPQINGIIFTDPTPVEPFALKSAAGKSFTIQDLRDHWTFIYFGYTHCPDACPIAMYQLKVLETKLRKMVPKQELSFVMVTIDPERDTPDLMQQYVNHFNPAFHGVSGDPKEIKSFATQFHVGYQRGEDNTAIGYAMYHSDTITVIDPQGQFAAVFASPHGPTNMANDFKKLLVFRSQ